MIFPGFKSDFRRGFSCGISTQRGLNVHGVNLKTAAGGRTRRRPPAGHSPREGSSRSWWFSFSSTPTTAFISRRSPELLQDYQQQEQRQQRVDNRNQPIMDERGVGGGLKQAKTVLKLQSDLLHPALALIALSLVKGCFYNPEAAYLP